MKENSWKSAFFKQILESIEDYAVFTTDRDGNITSRNKGAEKVLGYTTVIDYGIGIPIDKQGHLFKNFSRIQHSDGYKINGFDIL